MFDRVLNTPLHKWLWRKSSKTVINQQFHLKHFFNVYTKGTAKGVASRPSTLKSSCYVNFGKFIGKCMSWRNAFINRFHAWCCKMAKHTLKKSCGVNTARFLKYVWQFYNIMHERVNPFHTTGLFPVSSLLLLKK